MDKLSMCRICLTADVRMHLLLNTHLQDTYEKLTVLPLETQDSRPLVACYICYARLHNCYELRMNCLRSEEVFDQMLSINVIKKVSFEPQPDAVKLGMSPLLQMTVTEPTEDTETEKEQVNAEEATSDDADVKMEKAEVQRDVPSEDQTMDVENHIESSDPEDDIPLKMIKNETDSKLKRKKRVRVREKEKEDINKAFKVDAHEINLSLEEQMSNLLARANSLNYTLSPYKCELCYKGFVDTNAFENHKMKHDERSGAHECSVCRMRYRSAQHLRTHVITAHSRLFKCNKCGHVSHTANQARVHEKWHGGYTYECQLCSHKFRKPTSYLSHMRKRHPTEHVCDVCGESFVGKHGLQMHKSKTHRNDHNLKENTDEPAAERFCGECNIQFYSRDAWKRHILCSVKHTLNNDTSSHCGVCGAAARGAALARHLREHGRRLRAPRDPPPGAAPAARRAQAPAAARCNTCGLAVRGRAQLQAHVNRVHLGLRYDKNIVCELCGKHCTSNATLKYHQRTHTGERPYSCSSCSKRFSDSNQLRIHTRTHTGEKPYVCAVCAKSFTQKPALNRHYRVHTGDKPYSCQYCSRTFSQSNSLKLHVRTVHLKLPANNRKKTQNIHDKDQTIHIPETVN